jgi:spore maturation protein CgeB
MKVLLVSNSNKAFTNTNHYRLRAIEALGHAASFFDVRRYWTPHRLRAVVPGLERLEDARINQDLLRCCSRGKFDLCLVVGGHSILARTVRKVRAMGMRVVLWTSDIPHPQFLEHIMAAGMEYDAVFCAGTEMVDVLKENGRCAPVWLPFGCDAACHAPCVLTPEELKRYSRDISFVGSYYPHRRDVFAALTGFDLGIWGPRWALLPPGDPLRRNIAGAQLDYKEWVKAYRAARIVLVVHYQDGRVPCYQASPKLFEAMACGAFVLCDDQKDARALFQDGVHVVFFKDPVDLKAKVEYYLAHPDERERIAKAGRAEVLRAHTYRHRIAEILKGVEAVGK